MSAFKNLQSTTGATVSFIRQAAEAGTEHIPFTGPLSDDYIPPLQEACGSGFMEVRR